MTVFLPPLIAGSAAGTRVVVVVAHPDDEVLGCGVLLSRLGGDATLVHVTDGAPADGGDAARLGYATPADYARARRRELETAVAAAGVKPERLVSFDVPDQGATDHLVAVTRRLVPLLRGADVVLTHAYEGGHPDHDTVAFAVHHAVRLLGPEAPSLVEMPFYRASPADWLRQDFAPAAGAGPEEVLHLTASEHALKRVMYEAHASQAEVLGGFPIAVERFRLAPRYDFKVLPNDGLVLYERYGWGATGAKWLALALAALAAIDMTPSA